MKILIAIIMFVQIVSMSMAAPMTYYIRIDADGYIVDITSLETPGYTPVTFHEEIPAAVMNGCYRLVDGAFVLDQEKYSAWCEANQPQEAVASGS